MNDGSRESVFSQIWRAPSAALRGLQSCYLDVLLRLENRRAEQQEKQLDLLRQRRLEELRSPDENAIRTLSDEQLNLLLDLVGDHHLSAPLWKELQRREGNEQR